LVLDCSALRAPGPKPHFVALVLSSPDKSSLI
jgi:hypothetical protein